jgi:hypothetical protein
MIMSILFPDSGAVVLGRKSALEAKDRIGTRRAGLYRKMRVGRSHLHWHLKGAGSDLRAYRVIGTGQPAEPKRCEELERMQQKVQFLARSFTSRISHLTTFGLIPSARGSFELIRRAYAGRPFCFRHVMQHAEEICDHVVSYRGQKVDQPVSAIQISTISRRRFGRWIGHGLFSFARAREVERIDQADRGYEILLRGERIRPP